MAEPMQPTFVAYPYGGKGTEIMGATWAQAALAFVLMALRTYTNTSIVRSFKWDYFWAMLTLVFGLVAQAMLTVACASGLGNHITSLTAVQAVKALQWSWIGQILAIQSIGFGKIAVIAFLLRIQDRANSRKARMLVYFLYFIGLSNVVININQVILILTSCSPAARLWDQGLPGTCNQITRTNYVGYFQGAWASTSDVLLAIYPVIVFWNLRISTRVKMGLCFLMAGGLVAAAAGIAKTIYIKLISVSTDITYAISPLIMWAFTEQWLVLILGSLPPLRALFANVFQRISTNASRGRHHSSGYIQQSNHKSIPMYPQSSAPRVTTDTDSERKILSSEAGIMRTTHVQVLSNPKGNGDDSDDSLTGIERGSAY